MKEYGRSGLKKTCTDLIFRKVEPPGISKTTLMSHDGNVVCLSVSVYLPTPARGFYEVNVVVHGQV